MPLKNSVFEASKSVSTKTLLLKHYYRLQGITYLVGAPRVFRVIRHVLMFWGYAPKHNRANVLGGH